jgi:hypothetical protein
MVPVYEDVDESSSGFCKQLLGSIKGREFLGSLDDSQLPRKAVCTVWKSKLSTCDLTHQTYITKSNKGPQFWWMLQNKDNHFVWNLICGPFKCTNNNLME